MALAAVVLIGGEARAQTQDPEPGRIALDIGSTAPLALLWKLDGGVALRPDFTFAHFNTDGVGSGWRYDAGLSALEPFHRSGAFTPYIGARGGYVWFSQSDAPTDWSVAGIFGARFSIDPHFGVSAETGLIYQKLRTAGSSAPDQSTVQPWARLSALLFF